MSTRCRGGVVKLTLLALLVMFALLLLLNSLHTSSVELHELEQHNGRDHPEQQRYITDDLEKLAVDTIVRPPATDDSVAQSRPTAAEQDITLIEPVDEELVRRLEEELPEVDYKFWYHYAKQNKYSKGFDCGRYPDPLDLQLHNTYWQTFITANVTFRLYAAYLDMRLNQPGGVVRLLATANQINDRFPPTQCQLWFAGHRRPITVNVTEFGSVWIKKWGYQPKLNYPHLLSCPIPEALPPNLILQVPRTVSLVSSVCEDATNSLRIHYNRAEQRAQVASSTTTTTNSLTRLNFGVCIKGFDFPYVDLSERLVEWFELQRLLGATRIYAYMYDVHPAVQRVLDYYQRIGYLELRPLTLANGMPRLRHYQHMLLQQRRLVKRLNELIPYNDCFYRNMYRHDYMLNVDIDEVIMPLGALRTWQDIYDIDGKLTIQNCPGGVVSLCISNVYFTNVVAEVQNHEQLETEELFVLQHTLRYVNHSLPNWNTKCFHNTRYSVTLHNHFTLKWLPGCCHPRYIDKNMAQMHHYREPDFQYKMSELVEDRNAWKYATELRAAVEYVRLHLDDVQELSANSDDHDTLDAEQEREYDLEQAQEQQQLLQLADETKTLN